MKMKFHSMLKNTWMVISKSKQKKFEGVLK